MNKTELIAAIAEQAEISKKDAEKALKAFVDVVTEQLKEGEKVQLVGFGTFEVSERAAREGRNHQTGNDLLLILSSPKPTNLYRKRSDRYFLMKCLSLFIYQTLRRKTQ